MATMDNLHPGVRRDTRLVEIYHSYSEFQALLLRDMLKRRGIHCVIRGNEMPMQPGWNFDATHHATVLVRAQDERWSRMIVEEMIELTTVEDDEEFPAGLPSAFWPPQMHLIGLPLAALVFLALLALSLVISSVQGFALLFIVIILVVLNRRLLSKSLGAGIVLLPLALVAALAVVFIAPFAPLARWIKKHLILKRE